MNTSNTAVALLALALCVPATAMDDPPAASTAPPAAQAPAGQPGPVGKDSPAAASEARLAQSRGGDAAIANEATLKGTVTGNSAINVTTGSNIIDTGSFANASGMPMVIQNSGANVLIQNATVINLQLR